MSKKILTKKELEKLIGDGHESVKFVQKKTTSKSSEWWQFYHHIFVNDHQQQFVSCNTCKTLLFVVSGSGTNNLKSHFNSCIQQKDKSMGVHQQTVHEFFSSSKESSIPKQLKLRVTQACAEFCAVDGRAFNLITCDGFQNLAKVLFDAGRSMYKSSIQIKDLLPDSTTISRNVTRIYEEYKLHLINVCEQLKNFCLIVDQWTESFTGVSYCGMAIRYVDDNFRLFNFILGCFPYDAASHSALHLREFIVKKLEEFHLQLDSTKYVVSDNEPKMIATFRDCCIRIGCADHYLNKQLQHAFESEQIHLSKNKVEKVDCDIVQNLFNQIKKIVSYVRRAHQQQNLSRRLVSYSETRFNGGLLMMDTFRNLFFELPSVLVNGNLMMNYNMIEKDLLDEVCSFLGPFEEVIEALSEDQEPTLHRVIPLRQCLINKCKVEEDDSNGVTQLKVFLERRLNNAWPITDEHRLATILHPKLKNFDSCPEEKQNSIDVLKLEFEKHQLISSSSCTNSLASTYVNLQSTSSTSTSNKKTKTANLLTQCFDAKVDVVSKRSNPFQEIDDYLTSELNQNYYDDNSQDMDVLLYWKEHQQSFPILSSIAKKIFSIPASNTVIERLFSASKNVVTEKRTRLDTEKINQLLFLQKNLNTLKQLVNDVSRKRSISMSSTTTASSEESTCTIPKQQCLDTEVSLTDFDDTELFLD